MRGGNFTSSDRAPAVRMRQLLPPNRQGELALFRTVISAGVRPLAPSARCIGIARATLPTYNMRRGERPSVWPLGRPPKERG